MLMHEIITNTWKYFNILLVFLLFNNITLLQAMEEETFAIRNYHSCFIPQFDQSNNLKIAIRFFEKEKMDHYLLVDPSTLKTSIGKVADFRSRKSPDLAAESRYFGWKEIKNTRYMQALEQYTSPPFPHQNYGACRSDQVLEGCYLTVDLCPSVRPFDQDMFEELIKLSEEKKQAIPIALCVTGLWMIQYKDQFNWLKKQQIQNKLDITWVNHTYTHIYYQDLTNEENFLLHPTQKPYFSDEVLQTERILLKHGLIPSPFLRFPGLYSDEDLINKLKDHSLIPLGSDAWLAKNQPIKNGSFILVHGNGNERAGIKALLPQIPTLNFIDIGSAF